MIRRTDDLSPAARDAFDAVIDVRSPGEFADDHIPGALNLPVLDDAQRTEIGTEYVRGSKFQARRRGAALVARNIARHLETTLSDRSGGFRPLVHCWRGGQRSAAMATVMDQIGWRVTVLDGGHRTWRRRVVAALHDQPLAHRLVVLDGPTGVGKTRLLALLTERGVQTLDLERLAGHRGSLFGATASGQPPQKLFESRLHDAITRLDPTRPVLVEAESSRIGARGLPRSLWAAMAAAPAIQLDAPLDARAAYTVSAYADIAADPAVLDRALTRLPRHLSKAQVAEWRGMAASGAVDDLALGLIRDHYDPAYRRSRRDRPLLSRLDLPALGDADLSQAAQQIKDALDRAPPAP